MCRKSYQRNKYNAEKGGPKSLNDFYIEHIKAQIDRIKLWRPDATFTVQLEKPAKERLNNYHDMLRRNGGNTRDAKQQIAVQHKIGTKGKPKPLTLVEAVKVEHAEHIDANFSGDNKTLDYLSLLVVPWIEAEVESGEMAQMPPIEFLLNRSAAGERVIDPKTNYERWVAHVDGVDFEGEQSTPPPKKVKKLILKNSPPKPIKLCLKRPSSTAIPPASPAQGKRPGTSSDLPMAQGPSPAGDGSKKRKRHPAEDLPLYVPPPPPVKKRCASADSTGPKKRPSPLDTALANNTAGIITTTSATPRSDFTLVDVPPLIRRGMVFGGGTKQWVRRSELDDDEVSEIDCESPLAKKSKA